MYTYHCLCFLFSRTGESPYYLKNLSSGQYELLVIGKRKESLGSLRFKFTIERDGLCDPVIHLSSMPAANGSVAVSFHGECFTLPAGGVEETVQFQCSTAGKEFSPCEFVCITLKHTKITTLPLLLVHCVVLGTQGTCNNIADWLKLPGVRTYMYAYTPITLKIGIVWSWTFEFHCASKEVPFSCA